MGHNSEDREKQMRLRYREKSTYHEGPTYSHVHIEEPSLGNQTSHKDPHKQGSGPITERPQHSMNSTYRQPFIETSQESSPKSQASPEMHEQGSGILPERLNHHHLESESKERASEQPLWKEEAIDYLMQPREQPIMWGDPRQKEATAYDVQTQHQQELQYVEGGLDALFETLTVVVDETVKLVSEPAKKILSSIVGGTTFFLFGGTPGNQMTMKEADMKTSIRDRQKLLGLNLQEGTIDKIVKPLDNQPFDWRKVQEVMEEQILPDREANRDLEKAFLDLLPIINQMPSNHIKIEGPVYGLTVGDNNTVNLTFHEFLKYDGSAPQTEPGANSGKITPDEFPVSMEEKLKHIQGMKEANYSDKEIAALVELTGEKYPLYQQALARLGFTYQSMKDH